MKTFTTTQLIIVKISNALFAGALALMLTFGVSSTRADETCSSPYLARIEGQEEFVYVWTLGVEGMGDGSDKLVTVDAKPGSPNYGKVISSVSVGGRNEAHHGGFTDDRRQLWLAGLESSRVSFSTCTLIRRNRDMLKRSTILRKLRVARSDLTGRMPCRGVYSFHVSRMKKIMEAGPHWWNTATTATTSLPIGCQQRMTRVAQRMRTSQMGTGMMRACCREKTRYSLHRLPGRTTT